MIFFKHESNLNRQYNGRASKDCIDKRRRNGTEHIQDVMSEQDYGYADAATGENDQEAGDDVFSG